MDRKDKGYRADAAQFFVAGELCRRQVVAVVTMGNCRNTDILVSNAGGTRFCHVQVKTFVPGNKTVSVGMKAERDFGPSFFWVLAGIPLPDSGKEFEFYVVPQGVLSSARTVQLLALLPRCVADLEPSQEVDEVLCLHNEHRAHSVGCPLVEGTGTRRGDRLLARLREGLLVA